jgi:hypothetical protein
MSKFQCDECGSSIYIDKEGSGEDDNGEFEDYVCECGYVTRVYF